MTIVQQSVIDPRVLEARDQAAIANERLASSPEDEESQAAACVETRAAEAVFWHVSRWAGDFSTEAMKDGRDRLVTVFKETKELLEKSRSKYLDSVTERIARLEKFPE